ncbi:MAG: hypothetical protein ACRC62_27240 [Microcoleus sp.]
MSSPSPRNCHRKISSQLPAWQAVILTTALPVPLHSASRTIEGIGSIDCLPYE